MNLLSPTAAPLPPHCRPAALVDCRPFPRRGKGRRQSGLREGRVSPIWGGSRFGSGNRFGSDLAMRLADGHVALTAAVDQS